MCNSAKGSCLFEIRLALGRCTEWIVSYSEVIHFDDKSPFRPCGCDLAELFKSTGWAFTAPCPTSGWLVILPISRIERRRITFMGRTTDAIVAMLLSLRVQVNGNYNRVHASLKSSRGPRGISFAGSP